MAAEPILSMRCPSFRGAFRSKFRSPPKNPRMTKIQAMWATLLNAVRTRLPGIPDLLRRSMRILAWLIASLIGRWQWQAPAWLAWLQARRVAGSRYLAANPKHAALLALVIVTTG